MNEINAAIPCKCGFRDRTLSHSKKDGSQWGDCGYYTARKIIGTCEHGSLRRQCELCDRDDEITALKTKLKIAERALRIIAGKEQCSDNTLGNISIANAALAQMEKGNEKTSNRST
jgi:hypothetical protein